MITTISTKSFYETARFSLQKIQRSLASALKEESSGRLADVGAALGSQTRRSVSMRVDMSRITTIKDSNAIVTTRLETSQTVIGDVAHGTTPASGLLGRANEFLSNLNLGSTYADARAAEDAHNNLVEFIGLMNTTAAGEYLFAGINTDEQPVTDYYANPSAPPASEVTTAKTHYVSGNMQNFLDTEFANLFKDPPQAAGTWEDWSKASNDNIQSRIALNETIETSTNANEDAYRQLAQAYTMVAELYGTATTDDFRIVRTNAQQLIGTAIQGLTDEKARLGAAQARVVKASDRITTQISLLTTQIGSLEDVDPDEAATRILSLETQLQTAYALTSRLQNMRLLNYLT